MPMMATMADFEFIFSSNCLSSTDGSLLDMRGNQTRFRSEYLMIRRNLGKLKRTFASPDTIYKYIFGGRRLPIQYRLSRRTTLEGRNEDSPVLPGHFPG